MSEHYQERSRKALKYFEKGLEDLKGIEDVEDMEKPLNIEECHLLIGGLSIYILELHQKLLEFSFISLIKNRKIQ